MKIAHSVAEDAASVARARQILGDSILLMVDVSGSCTADQTPLAIRAIERFGIHWIEEPLDWTGDR